MLKLRKKGTPNEPPRREGDVNAWVLFAIGLVILAVVFGVAVLMTQ